MGEEGEAGLVTFVEDVVEGAPDQEEAAEAGAGSDPVWIRMPN